MIAGLKCNQTYLRRRVVSKPTMTEKLLEFALNHDDISVRMNAAVHANMTTRLLEIAINDENVNVVDYAAVNVNMTDELRMLTALKRRDYEAEDYFIETESIYD